MKFPNLYSVRYNSEELWLFFFFSLGTVPAAVAKVSGLATSSVILTANSDLLFTQTLFRQITEAIKHGKLCSFLLLAILYTAVIELMFFRTEMKIFP